MIENTLPQWKNLIGPIKSPSLKGINMDKDKFLPAVKREEIFMASSIASTPVLKGQDLVRLVKDINIPDKNKDRRQKALKALKALMSISK